MITGNKSDKLTSVRQRKFLNKTFPAFKRDIVDYSRAFYPDKGTDFSDASFGGMMVDMAAYVGDVMSFYLDHQFSELHSDTMVEDINIERALRSAGVRIVGASPAVVSETFYIEVPAVLTSAGYSPDPLGLPILKGFDTVVKSDSGVEFVLTDDINFAETDENGNLLATISVATTDSTNAPLSFVLSKSEDCISGKIKSETFSIGSFIKFRRITLAAPDVTEIVSVKDSDNNVYYEVESLVHDSVFSVLENTASDAGLVEDVLELVTAPYRFTIETALETRQTTLVFGGGNADTLEDDIIPDPSEFAIPLFGRKTFAAFTLDPNRLLTTTTFGVAKENVTLTITYRCGGGLSHSVEAGSIKSIVSNTMVFPRDAGVNIMSRVKSSLDMLNLQPARGGDDAPTTNDLRQLIPSARNAQARIVTKSDLLARIYTMPSNFGRVYRGNVRSSTNNQFASQLFIVSRDRSGHLAISPDTLKKNLRIYLNHYRMISDAIDIIDAQIINFTVEFEVVIDRVSNKQQVLKRLLDATKKYFNIKNMGIDKPISIDDFQYTLYNDQNVVAVSDISIRGTSGQHGDRAYSSTMFDVQSNTFKRFIVPPPGGIFELKYPDYDIRGNAT